MANANVTVLLPAPDDTHSVEVGVVTKVELGQNDGITIAGGFDGSGNITKKALANKNNSLVIFVENSYATAKSYAYIKAGDNYPNAILGDLQVDLGTATAATQSAPLIPVTTAIILEDISRFENRDGSINITFTDNSVCAVWAVAKRAGIEAAADQGAFGTTNA